MICYYLPRESLSIFSFFSGEHPVVVQVIPSLPYPILQIFHHLFCLYAFTCSALQGQKDGSYLSIKVV